MEIKELAKIEIAQKVEQVLVGGDLSQLSPQERVSLYKATCESLGLNPLTRPFDYLKLNGKLILYARKDATEQLRKNNKISITQIERNYIEDIYEVVAHAEDIHGRKDVDVGVVNLKGLTGDNRANAIMKAVTKSKRRVTLSICGLGFLDETEIETIDSAEIVKITDNGEIVESKPVAQSKPPAGPKPSISVKRPYSPEVLKVKIAEAIDRYQKQGLKASDQSRNMVAANMELCFASDNAEDMRHTVTLYLTGKGSVKDLSDAEVVALSRWINSKPDNGGKWHPDPLSIQEANAVYTEALKNEGQLSL